MAPRRLDQMLGAVTAASWRDPRSDAELLTRFLEDGDEHAFEVLLVRHTPAVRAACRGWLRSPADLDDAAQATFLVLVQRAHSISNRAVLSGWLYRVAVHVARRLCRQRRPSVPVPDELAATESAPDDGLREVLVTEVARLPEKYRLPIQLCYMVGLSTTEAAQRLACPRGTILTRLAWARQRLRKCLARRGVGPAGLSAVVGAVTPAVRASWLQQTVQAARAIRAGQAPSLAGVSELTASLTEGVVNTMIWNKVKVVALAVLLAAGLVGFGMGRWLQATPTPDTTNTRSGPEVVVRGPGAAPPQDAKNPAQAPADKDAVRAEDAKPGVGRRREATIRMPSGTFVKDVDVAQYGSGRITFNYEEDRVLSLIELSVMGFEVEVATEAEISLSSNGTIYGLITGVKLNHVRLPQGGEFGEQMAELQPYLGLWPLIEPLIQETLTDLPFSYRFRMQGDRLVISNYRILMAGPNPGGKIGSAMLGDPALIGCQVLGTALEGSYIVSDGKEKPEMQKRPVFRKPGQKIEVPRLRTGGKSLNPSFLAPLCPEGGVLRDGFVPPAPPPVSAN